MNIKIDNRRSLTLIWRQHYLELGNRKRILTWTGPQMTTTTHYYILADSSIGDEQSVTITFEKKGVFSRDEEFVCNSFTSYDHNSCTLITHHEETIWCTTRHTKKYLWYSSIEARNLQSRIWRRGTVTLLCNQPWRRKPFRVLRIRRTNKLIYTIIAKQWTW